jgi:hypothetical protein
MRTHIRLLAFAAVISAVYASPALLPADESSATVKEALTNLNDWLGAGPAAKGWSDFLNLPAIRAELEKGNDADLATLEAVEAKLNSGAPGLELARFRALSSALAGWTAQLEISQSPSLSQAALEAQKRFRPITAQDVATAKQALQEATAKLALYLSKGQNSENWKKYLRFNDLQAQLKAEKADLTVLADIYFLFTANQVGLELPVFANVADALERYVNDLAAQDGKLQEQFNEQLKGLAAALDQYAKTPSADLAADIGGRLGWLANRRQVPALIEAIREKLSHPNLLVIASERLVGAGITQSVDEVTPVRDYILGTSISGTGRMIGSVTAELVPSENSAMIDTLLKGTVQSRTVGLNGPATIYSNGATALAGRKRIVLNADGFLVYPSTAAANTNTQVTGIGGSGIVQRVASRRVGEQKGQAERIAADHAADRLRGRLDKQINDQLAEANTNFQTKFRQPLVRRRALPELAFRTTAEELLVKVVAADRNQIAAPGTPPELNSGGDLGAQVHESAINNLATILVGGLTLTEEELQKRVIEIRGSLPDSLKSDEDRDPWSITFARNQPVSVKLQNDTIEITVRGQRYTSGDQDFRAMNVTARYQVQLTEPNELGIHAIKLTRQGDLEIVPPGEPRRLSGREITLRTLLEKRFGKLFEPEIVYDELVLPGRWRQAGLLDPRQLSIKDGWLVTSLAESGVPAPPEANAPAEEKSTTTAQANSR